MAVAGTFGAGLIVLGPASIVTAAGKEAKKEEEISPVEDLMREHGVLRRVLLIYEESLRRIDTGRGLPREVIPGAAGIIRRFIEDYHEKLEENEIFPRFERAGKLTDLVKVLYDQHKAGRRVTDAIMKESSPATLLNPKSRQRLGEAIRAFIRLYRPHAAREDTVLFPALRSVVSGKEYKNMGERFEDKEHELFGEGGFGKIVDEVAFLEKQLGIYELVQFTPKMCRNI
jgi:hemerythrin-like domain-containing protein